MSRRAKTPSGRNCGGCIWRCSVATRPWRENRRLTTEHSLSTVLRPRVKGFAWELWEENSMKKLMTLMLGLSIGMGNTALFAGPLRVQTEAPQKGTTTVPIKKTTATKPAAKPAQFTETALSSYREGLGGGFSPWWVGYILEPQRDQEDKSWFLELNGKKLGPYDDISRLVPVSSDGRHIAFAAKSSGRWHVIVDGEEKSNHADLTWPHLSLMSGLERNIFEPNTQAAVLQFSPDGKSLAYTAKLDNGGYAVIVDGKPGPTYSAYVGAQPAFVAGKVQYYALPMEGKFVEVHGKTVSGPYEHTYTTKISGDGNHYCLRAVAGGKNILVVDDKETVIPGEIGEYVIGYTGLVACTYQEAGKTRVRFGLRDLPGTFDEVLFLTISPDGKKVAYWARTGDEWSLMQGDKPLPGQTGYYVYRCGGEDYSIMWGPDSDHIAYYVRQGKEGTLALDGEMISGNFSPDGGVHFGYMRDSNGATVGQTMTGGQFERQAFVQAVLMRNTLHGDPFSATLCNKQLCYVDKQADGTFVVIGSKREGPYQGPVSAVTASPDGKHYCYVISTANGNQLVIDGSATGHIYEKIYLVGYYGAVGSVHYLGLKGGTLFGVSQPLPTNR